MCGDVPEVGGLKSVIADDAADGSQLLVGDLQEFFEKTEFVHQFESGRMDRMAAKIPEKIVVLFENGDRNTGAGEEIAEHHPGRPTTDDTAGGIEGSGGHALS